MVEKIGLSANEATIQYHTFTTAVFVTCIFGAIVADVKFEKILSSSFQLTTN